jgi:flagellar basal body-associated protein FliL
MLKKRPIQRKHAGETNKKALLWIGIAFAIVFFLMATLLYFIV